MFFYKVILPRVSCPKVWWPVKFLSEKMAEILALQLVQQKYTKLIG